MNPVVIKEYFKHLEDVSEKKNSPRQLAIDESFVPLDRYREKAVTLKSSRNTYMQAQGTLVMLCAASVAELSLPPIISVSQVVSTTL